MAKSVTGASGKAKRGWPARYWAMLLAVAVALSGFLGWYDSVRNQGKLFVCDLAALLGQDDRFPACVEGIPPLKDPKSIPVPSTGSVVDPNGGSSIIASASADITSPAKLPAPRTTRILEGQSNSPQRRVFDITIENPSDRQVTLDSWEVRWRYYRGAAAGVEKAAVITPTERYTITLDIDTGDTSQRSKSVLIASTIVLPAGSEQSPSIYVFRLELLYAFDKGLTYHPNSNWDIVFDLDVKATSGQTVPIFRNANWRD